MSQDAVELARASVEAWTGPDPERALDLMSEDIVLDGKGSGAAMHQDGATLMTLREGLIVSMVLYLYREKAFADAGLTA
jgi:hypothetical protein